MAEQAPRINSQYLDAFTGQTVTITGKVSQIRGETAVIDANGEVTVLLNRVCTPHLNYHINQETNTPLTASA
jgi:DNA/RNA endonuclease YhcR with UshA esterase domain